MKKILLVDSTYPINTRNVRLLSSLKKILGNYADISLLVWNRDESEMPETDIVTYTYREPAAYGNALAKLFKLKGFGEYIRKVNQALKPDYIIASHWEVLWLCAKAKIKGQQLIYENLDMPTASNPILLRLLQLLERSSLRKADAIIHASRFYPDKYTFFKGKQVLIENRPPQSPALNQVARQYAGNDPLRVAFTGIIRYFDVLKNLIDAAENLQVEILFYGDGPDMGRLKAHAEGKKYVRFFGRYNYGEIAGIYATIDLIWAVYPSEDYNVKYAISNKFFESMVLNKPAVFAEDTELGRMVRQKGTGLAVSPYDGIAIRKLLSEIAANREMLADINRNISAAGEKLFWEDEEQRLAEVFN
jgi:glycosyltransferase involved in cell wall biosynthesis